MGRSWEEYDNLDLLPNPTENQAWFAGASGQVVNVDIAEFAVATQNVGKSKELVHSEHSKRL